MSNVQKVTVPRSVHYYPATRSPNPELIGQPQAAIVTAVHSETCVDLFLMPPGQAGEPATLVQFSPEPKPGHWTWPPRI